ncbi:hypothetical protein GPK34_00275 [Secundilactobacillus kimchicus]|uniref:pentapeptide repeat-containing protein n=1 Tax=Secundilactobacillus kimchicus TaxID=528209 RepID=UPI001C01156E|nr:pentapeptide repeat-containing protein [Secundilactobacillus kimchicus]MBT9670472.1 hypothetical protein [Secundilactobacillus kimchicus]
MTAKHYAHRRRIKGYKVFDEDWTCRGMHYDLHEVNHIDGDIEICQNGMHFCQKLEDCFRFYEKFKGHVAEIEAWGWVDDSNGDSYKMCASNLKIVREIGWGEVADTIMDKDTLLERLQTSLKVSYPHNRYNTGLDNAGGYNVGSHNSGDHNTGNHNTGHYNSGCRNSGNTNSGDGNSGNFNLGSCNSGDFNSGDYNSGHYNSGDFNTVDHSADFFSTKSRKLRLFNKKVDLTREELVIRLTQSGLYSMPKPVDDNGKEIGKATLIAQRQQWWEHEADKKAIKTLPNFNPEVFKECTGIDVGTTLVKQATI